MSTPIEVAVRTAIRIDIDQVPESVKQQVRNIIADTVAVIQAGSALVEPAALRKLNFAQGRLTQAASGRSTVFAGSELYSADAELAAYLNGTSGTFLELDEGMRPTGHAAIHVVPAALAVAEEVGASGPELLKAVLSGYEVVSRLFAGIALNYPIHPHGHLGAIGAAVAVAVLRDTDPVEAAAIAATTPVFSVWEPCFEGATARNSWPGIAAQNGVRSQQLAEAGFTGSFRNMEIAFTELVGSYRDETLLTAPLDYSALGVTRNYFKFHSCCALNHAAVEAVEALLDSVDAEQIDHIVVETVANNMKLDRQAHENNLSSRFSLQYAIAARFLAAESSIPTFDYRPEVREFAERIRVENAEDLQELWPDSSPARLVVSLRDGTQRESRVDNPRGHFKNPQGPDDLHNKFVYLWGDQEGAEAVWQSLMQLDNVDNVAELFHHG